jgi:hypothetical protein
MMQSRRTSAALTLGVVACGVFGAWAAGASPWSESEIDRSVGLAGIVAFVLAALALFRRSWARLPLIATCVLAVMLTQSALFTEYDPSAMTLFGYFALSCLLIVAPSFALVIMLADSAATPRSS